MDSDSDFYGDEETVSALEARVASFDVVSWWDRHPSTITTHRQPPLTATSTTTPHQHNPYETSPSARQLTESIPAFLARLPPATTDWRPGLDWIWIANPFHPPARAPLLAQFRKGGAERLALFAQFEKMTTTAGGRGGGGGAAKAQRDVAAERREAVADLKALAGACHVVTGKWMLFPEPGQLNEVWGKVARATAEGGLGTVAKVETRVESGKARLVCVYTRDFRDKEDVARVLGRMRELELVRPGWRQIYYKSDAWTELGIYGGNEWGIGASMYSSNEIFGYIKMLASGKS